MNRSSYGLIFCLQCYPSFRIILSYLGIIAYCCFSIIRGKNNEESDEYESYESSSSGMTWEDMEREYGISIERKVEEPSSQDSILTVDDTSFGNRPKDDVSTPLQQLNKILRFYLRNALVAHQAIRRIRLA